MKHISILPWPREIRVGDRGLSARGLRWRMAPGAGDLAIQTKLKELKLRAKVDEGLAPWTMVTGTAALADEMVPEYPEGYALKISDGGVSVRGRDARGLYWGLTTLEQMMMNGGRLPAVEIRDWPTIAVRYHHDDVSRKQISRMEDFERIIRLLSLWKINHYTPYLEDMLHLNSFPDIGEGRGKLYPDEVAQLVEFGAKHNVTVFPTFSLIGHQENLLRLPKYAHLGRKVWQPASSLDVKNPAVRPFLEKVIADVCAMWPGELFHMGFDETQGLGAEEFIEHANWCARELAKYGKRAVMWVDMIYNHFGYEQIRRLDENIIPVNWQYGVNGEIPHQVQLEAHGRPVWGLAGYGTWCAFLPDLHAGRGNYAAWVKAIAGKEPWRDVGLGSSQWGDNGYENLRELAHNAFASFAEHAWSGERADDVSFDARFAEVFYGGAVKSVAVADSLAREMTLSPGRIWRLHRARPEELLRRVKAGDLNVAKVKRDLGRAREVLKGFRKERPARNAGHLGQYEAGLARTASVLERICWTEAPGRRAAVIEGLAQARNVYREMWLKHNRPENLEVSLAVFDRAMDWWGTSGRERWSEARWLPLDLTRAFNRLMLEVGGVPIGERVVNGVPMRFAGADKTHVEITRGKPLLLKVPRVAVKDVHLVVSGPRPADGLARPALRLRLLDGKRELFREDLLRVRHICDWWAPLGNHIWAGGGLAYVDPARVKLGLEVADFYALMQVGSFGLAGSPVADRVELEVVDEKAIQLFAITLEKAVR